MDVGGDVGFTISEAAETIIRDRGGELWIWAGEDGQPCTRAGRPGSTEWRGPPMSPTGSRSASTAGSCRRGGGGSRQWTRSLGWSPVGTGSTHAPSTGNRSRGASGPAQMGGHGRGRGRGGARGPLGPALRARHGRVALGGTPAADHRARRLGCLAAQEADRGGRTGLSTLSCGATLFRCAARGRSPAWKRAGMRSARAACCVRR
jgi:hypothetical protein